MTDLRSDLRTALRQWRRRPALPLTAVATLALGLGAAIAVFAVTWAVAWRPLDVPEPQRLVWIEAEARGAAGQSSPGAFAAWQTEARTLDAIAAIRPVVGVVADATGTDRLPGALVTASIGPLFDVRPALGRAITADDDAPGAPRVLLVSHRLWQTRFGGDAGIVGRAVTLNGGAATIVGVLPPIADTLVPEADWWAPLALDARDRTNIGPRYLDVIGRLAPETSPAAARADLTAIGRAIGLTADDASPLDVRLTPLDAHLVGAYGHGLALLLAGVAVLVLIACANVAALLLTRAQDRGPELALRTSLGASRGRLVRQLLIEAALLAGLATAGGLLTALWLTDLLRVLLPAEVPRVAEARIDVVTTAFALALGVTVTLAAGLLPALRGTRVDLQPLLRLRAAGAAGDDHLRRAFVVAQVALAVVLGAAGALLTRSAAALDAAPRGYDAAGVVTTTVTLPAAPYRDATAIATAIDRIVTALAAVPGTSAVSAASQVPFSGGSAGSDLALADEAFTAGVDRQVRVRLVAADYLRTIGAVRREGRDIARTDTAGTAPVLVVNETLARRLVPAGSPLGRAVKFGVPVFNGDDGGRVWTVVGVAADTWDRGPRAAVEPEVLIPLAQTPAEVFAWISRKLQLVVRTTRSAPSLAADLRTAVRAVDAAIPMAAVRTVQDGLDASFARERLLARLLAAVGLAGVTLALLALVAVVHHQVRRRRRDIAIRLALGASAHGVVGQLVGDGVRLASAGAALGVLAAAGTSGAVAALLYGVAPGDPLTLLLVAATVVGAAVIAAWLPARAAARVDPVEILRT